MNERIYLTEGKGEFKQFLEENNIKFKHYAEDSLDASTWIGLVGGGLTLLDIILKFKNWYPQKNEKSTIIININQTATININNDS